MTSEGRICTKWMRMDSSHIDSTLQEINKYYHRGTLPWIKKNRPEWWREIISLEKEINRASLFNDMTKLEKLLEAYRVLIFKMVKTFLTSRK